MDDTKLERWAPLAGVVFVVLVLVGGFIAGSPPATSDSAAKIGKFFADNDYALKCGAFISGLASIPFLVFLGVLYARLRGAEGDHGRLSLVMFGGGVLSAALILVAFAVFGAIAISVDEIGGGGTKFFYILANGLTGMAGLALVVVAGATALVTFRTQALPAWLGWLSVASAVLWIPGGLVVASDSDAAFVINIIAFPLFLVWVLATSIVLFRTQTAATTR